MGLFPRRASVRQTGRLMKYGKPLCRQQLTRAPRHEENGLNSEAEDMLAKRLTPILNV